MKSSSIKKTLERVGIVFLSVILVCAIAVTALFWNEFRSLASIEKVDEYGMLQMTYYGDYGFDEFLQVGAESDSDIESFVTKRLLKGLPFDFNVTGAGCTAFVAHDEKNNVLFARNFDFEYAPSMQVYTTPKNGYASVSTVNLSFAGYSKEKLPSGINPNSFLALAAPYLPFDGMNEKGVAIALLAVPKAGIEKNDSKVTLNTTTSIRLVLDKAATVEEAVELLRQYNIYFSGGIDCHFLIADATGKSVLVEYYDNGLQVVESSESYQIASNFIAYNGLNIGEGFTEFERYETVENTLRSNSGTISAESAIELLADVGVYDNEYDKLQWSVVYDLSSLSGTIFANRNTENLISFELTS